MQRLGYALVVRNHRTRFGAIWDALDGRKRRQVRQMARAFLHDEAPRPAAAEIRFDAIGVVIDDHGGLVRLDHLEAAF